MSINTAAGPGIYTVTDEKFLNLLLTYRPFCSLSWVIVIYQLETFLALQFGLLRVGWTAFQNGLSPGECFISLDQTLSLKSSFQGIMNLETALSTALSAASQFLVYFSISDIY